MIWNVLQGNMIKMIYEGHLGTENSERGQRYFLVFLKWTVILSKLPKSEIEVSTLKETRLAAQQKNLSLS